MGMSIEKSIEFFNGLECHTPQAKDARDVAIETMRRYQMMQADYENRLNADLVAMLEEIDLQFDEICFCRKAEWKTVPEIKAEYKAVIHQKINSLKENNQDD